MLRSIRDDSRFDHNFRDYRRDAALLQNPFLRSRSGERGFHNFHMFCGKIVFRTQRQDGAGAVEDIADKLQRRGAHLACRVDPQPDVVNRLPAMNRLRDHQLFVLAPCKLGVYTARGVRSGLVGFARLAHQVADVCAQGLARGRLQVSAVGGQHGVERVRCCEHHLSKRGAPCFHHLRRQDVFQFVCELA